MYMLVVFLGGEVPHPVYDGKGDNIELNFCLISLLEQRVHITASLLAKARVLETL